MAYNPQTEDISRLFDLDVSDDPEDNTGLNFEDTSGMETPIFNPSTPMPSLNLSSALAGRRKGQSNPTSTDEVDWCPMTLSEDFIACIYLVVRSYYQTYASDVGHVARYVD